jgi:hypothetical protein
MGYKWGTDVWLPTSGAHVVVAAVVVVGLVVMAVAAAVGLV